MGIATLRTASIIVIGLLLPILLFVNIFIGNTLFSFGFLLFIVGLLLAMIGVFIWVFCNFLENCKPFSPFGLYLAYGGLAFLLIGIICCMIIPAIHSFGQQWVFPD